MKMTIRRLADLAGVSRGTVDKVLHDRPGVSDEVREQVWRIIQEQGYQLPVRKKAEKKTRRRLRLVIVIPHLSNDFFQIMKHGMDDACALHRDANILVEYLYCNSENINELMYLLQYIATEHVDGILIRGSQSTRLRDRLNTFSERGIPVVLFDSDVHGCRKLCFVGENSKASGRVAASLLAKSIGEKGDVAIIGGVSEMRNNQLRIQGFQDVMHERFPNIHIVKVVNCYDQSAIAYEETDKLLQQYPKLRGIFSVVGCTADIGQVLIDRNMKTVKMVSYNITSDIVALVKRGIVTFTIGLEPYQQGVVAVNTMLTYLLEGKKPQSEFVEMPLLIGIDENIDMLLQNQQR
ncbi:MAG: LacI family DNA-binding transcriptional regulator [Eubacteriales bacterium]|nr:LacI family DNA-binding transcriptional regulator [Eubacteriales bacterium]